MKSLQIVMLFSFFSLVLFSCAFAPVNNQYEKAGTLKKGNIELSGNYTRYSGSGGGETISTNNNLGFRAGYGISDKFDLKLRYERLAPTNGFGLDLFDEDVNDDADGKIKAISYYSIVPKFALIPEKLSLLIPISHYSFQEEIEGEENGNLNSIAPQLIYTLSNSKNKTDFSFGLKADCLFGNGGGGGVLLGTTIGAGFSSDLSKWAVRPEVGASFLGGGAFLSYGIGLQLILVKKKSN